MSSRDVIRIEGDIVAVVQRVPKALFKVELANGHRLLAFAGRKIHEWAVGLECGDRVTVEVSPFDFSTGRLCAS